MKILNADFITSAVTKSQYPKENYAEIAFVGRSNVGKSSIINSILNRKKIAKVSSTPGKTKLINFFLINNNIYLVDLPGYGYAKVSKTERESWRNLVETYLLERQNLKTIVLLIDSRHIPIESDLIMYEYLKHYNHNIKIVATKSDKLTSNEKNMSKIKAKKYFNFNDDQEICLYSCLKNHDRDKLIEYIFN